MFLLRQGKLIFHSSSVVLIALLLFQQTASGQEVTTVIPIDSEKISSALSILTKFFRGEDGIKWLHIEEKNPKWHTSDMDLLTAILESDSLDVNVRDAAKILKDGFDLKNDNNSGKPGGKGSSDNVNQAFNTLTSFIRSDSGVKWLSDVEKDPRWHLPDMDLLRIITETTSLDAKVRDAAKLLKDEFDISDSTKVVPTESNVSDENWNNAIADLEGQDDIVCLYRKHPRPTKFKRSEDWKKLLDIAPGYTIHSVSDRGSKYLICLKKMDSTTVPNLTDEENENKNVNVNENNIVDVRSFKHSPSHNNNRTENLPSRRVLYHEDSEMFRDNSDEECSTNDQDDDNDGNDLKRVTPLYSIKSINHLPGISRQGTVFREPPGANSMYGNTRFEDYPYNNEMFDPQLYNNNNNNNNNYNYNNNNNVNTARKSINDESLIPLMEPFSNGYQPQIYQFQMADDTPFESLNHEYPMGDKLQLQPPNHHYPMMDKLQYQPSNYPNPMMDKLQLQAPNHHYPMLDTLQFQPSNHPNPMLDTFQFQPTNYPNPMLDTFQFQPTNYPNPMLDTFQFQPTNHLNPTMDKLQLQPPNHHYPMMDTFQYQPSNYLNPMVDKLQFQPSNYQYPMIEPPLPVAINKRLFAIPFVFYMHKFDTSEWLQLSKAMHDCLSQQRSPCRNNCQQFSNPFVPFENDYAEQYSDFNMPPYYNRMK